jgi:hypothetical protein
MYIDFTQKAVNLICSILKGLCLGMVLAFSLPECENLGLYGLYSKELRLLAALSHYSTHVGSN